MIRNVLRELLHKDKPTIGTHMNTTSPRVVEAIGAIGKYDYVEFTTLYAPWEWIIRLEDMQRAAELYDLGTMVKIDQDPKTYLTQRALQTNANSILVTDCRNAKDVEEAIKAVKPEPDGIGDIRLGRRMSLAEIGQPDRRQAFIEYVRSLDDVVICIMIEKKAAVDNLEEILSVKGVDMIQWGPGDYSLTMRAGYDIPPMRSDATWKVERKVMATALKMGVRPRVECEVEDMQKYIDLGARDFCIGRDTTAYINTWTHEGAEIRKILDSNQLT
jgi:2-keto-3-deoxy-L-rhamnonate aldolase RhmA